MKITGKMLKERRESLKLSLSEISMQTKVNQKILKAIEEGDAAQLPAKTFLRGFVQAYAIALKLDVDPVMKSFFEEMGTTTPEVAEAEDASAQVISGRTLPTSMQSSATVKVLAVSGIVVLILLVFGVKSLVEKYEQESRVEPVPETLASLPAATETTAAKTETAPSETTAPATESDAAAKPAEGTSATEVSSVTAKPPEPAAVAPAAPIAATPPAPTPPAAAPMVVAPVVVKPPEAASKPASVEPAKPAPTIVAAPPVTPPPVVAPKVEAPAAKPPVAATPPPATAAAPPAVVPPVVADAEKKPAAIPAGSKEVILEALDRIEVAVKVDKGALKKIVLQPDEVYTIKGLGKITLDLSDGGAVNLIVNGQDRGVPGDLGKPKKVELP